MAQERKEVHQGLKKCFFPMSDSNTTTTLSITTVNTTSGETEDSSSSSSLAVEAVILVLTISVPIILFIVVIFCSPSSKRREILNAMAARPANQSAAANRLGNENKPSSSQQTTVDMVTMVNARETVVLSNCRISTY